MYFDLFKKWVDFRNCNDKNIQTLQNIFNNRPQKNLGFMISTKKMVKMLQNIQC